MFAKGMVQYGAGGAAKIRDFACFSGVLAENAICAMVRSDLQQPRSKGGGGADFFGVTPCCLGSYISHFFYRLLSTIGRELKREGEKKEEEKEGDRESWEEG
jgi:hypothetical protein